MDLRFDKRCSNELERTLLDHTWHVAAYGVHGVKGAGT